MPNRLALESSPYLRQHADNPVDWHPWGEEALALARRERKPILLSIGYSACHWCHVMAHESFENGDVAAVMNALYVNVKVDREERPDLDKVYQLAHQALSRRGGGWPLTVFLAPDDLLPFFAGTYFPPVRRHGMPAFVEVLRGVRDWFDRSPGEVREQNRSLAEFIAHHYDPAASGGAAHDPGAGVLATAVQRLARAYDPRHGGFGQAPKFPHASDLALLLDLEGADAPEDVRTAVAGLAHAPRAMVEHTLTRMAEGGIHDQLGGGFARYSVDAEWAIPHFEKMLYDNAALLPLYAEAAVRLARADFAAVAQGIAGWLEREMRAPDGGYYAALDADSEGHEGRYYVWRREQVRALLDDDEWAVASAHYGFDRAPNFEGEDWNPIVARPLDEVAGALGMDAIRAAEALSSARATLFEARATRMRPGTDDKVLTAWNALLVSGYARAAAWLDDEEFTDHAAAAFARLRRDAWHDGRLYAKPGPDGRRFPGYLDDHAFALEAALDLLVRRFDLDTLAFARALADALLARFEDTAAGGFWFTAHDHETLIGRPKSWFDESMASGNGAATRALQRLGHLVADTRYLDAATRALRAAGPTLIESPQGCASMLAALHMHLVPPTQVVMRADPADRGWRTLASELARAGIECYRIPDAIAPASLPGVLADRVAHPGGVAYVCTGTVCLAPCRTPDELRAAVASRSATTALS